MPSYSATCSNLLSTLKQSLSANFMSYCMQWMFLKYHHRDICLCLWRFHKWHVSFHVSQYKQILVLCALSFEICRHIKGLTITVPLIHVSYKIKRWSIVTIDLLSYFRFSSYFAVNQFFLFECIFFADNDNMMYTILASLFAVVLS